MNVCLDPKRRDVVAESLATFFTAKRDERLYWYGQLADDRAFPAHGRAERNRAARRLLA